MKTVTYAIGDIHGRLDLLEELLILVESDARRREARALVVFTGDYVDRGGCSRGVVDRLMAGPSRADDRFLCLRGNHDDLFVRAATTGDGVPDWAWFLFRHTLRSYGDDAPGRDALRRHVRFLRDLPYTHDDGTHLFVHAGIRPGVPIADQLPEELIWIREPFLSFAGPLPRRVVHGHTIMGDRPVVTDNRISIDTGAYRSGILTAAVLDGGDLAFLQTAGRPDEGAVRREEELGLSIGRGFFEPELDRTPPLAAEMP
ncbi:metallophosphoesterase family protein [Rhizosaccharibacter radicis]|uniref:Serine/threonine protein phosphatase n=1 Tax=Rhizosaccharibacter radicis TaxID=2782605 RepID=A0ABT1VUP5_9PROT|nr:serine/threonine protein phosphatase [Acetobacteraceae bacterium KSS12]